MIPRKRVRNNGNSTRARFACAYHTDAPRGCQEQVRIVEQKDVLYFTKSYAFGPLKQGRIGPPRLEVNPPTHPPVEGHRDAGKEGGPVGSEEADEVGDFLGEGYAP